MPGTSSDSLPQVLASVNDGCQTCGICRSQFGPAYWMHLNKFRYQQINIPKQIQQQLLPVAVAGGEELVWQRSLS